MRLCFEVAWCKPLHLLSAQLHKKHESYSIWFVAMAKLSKLRVAPVNLNLWFRRLIVAVKERGAIAASSPIPLYHCSCSQVKYQQVFKSSLPPRNPVEVGVFLQGRASFDVLDAERSFCTHADRQYLLVAAKHQSIRECICLDILVVLKSTATLKPDSSFITT